MLQSAKNLVDYSIEAKDGSIGTVESFLFEENWQIRYMVVDTGKWLPGRRVLLVPGVIGKPEGISNVLSVQLTKEQVKNSPDIDANKPISSKQREELHKHYGWPLYWTTGSGPVMIPQPPAAPGVSTAEQKDLPESDKPERLEKAPKLRSTKEVIKYHIKARDGEIGHVDDFIIDDAQWIIRFLVVDTRNWLPGRKVLIPPDWAQKIDWALKEVEVDVIRDEVRDSPKFDPSVPVNRDYEVRYYDYYGRPVYWV